MSHLYESEKFNKLRHSFIGYLGITEKSVMDAYHESSADIIFERSLTNEHATICLNSAKIVLERKKIPNNYAQLLLEPFENKYVPKDIWFPINTFARLRLAYDLSMFREPKKVIHERYKTLAIMTDPKMHVIKHTLEMWLLNLISWRF